MHALTSIVLLAVLSLQPATASTPAQHDASSAHPVQAAHAHDSHPAGAEPAYAQHPVPAVPPATRWQADAALTRGMAQLRELSHALQALSPQPEAGAVAALGERVETTVHTLFAECRLAPEPDAALHALLAQVLEARRQLGAPQADPAAAHAILERVLAQYGERFVDQR